MSRPRQPSSPRWLTTAEAAARLGIKPASLYAYVSRGVLTRRHGPDGRSSRYDADEIEALARRGRPRRTTRDPTVEIVVASSVTDIPAGPAQRRGHRYRGRRAVDLADRQPFEAASGWVLDGGDALAVTLPVGRRRDDAGARLGDGRGDRFDVLVRMRAALDQAAVADPLRLDLSSASVRATASSVLSTMVAAVGGSGSRGTALLRLADGQTYRSSVAGHLAAVLSGSRRPDAWVTEAVNAALVLMIDHELATSTLAARVAASTRADPYSCVIAALATLSGPLHGTASAVVRQAIESDAPIDRLAERAGGSRLPGFGHPVYAGIDPRAAALLERVRRGAPDHPSLDAARRLTRAVDRRTGVPPNVDLGLAVLCSAAGLRPDAGSVIFAVARAAGWLAHVNEEYAAMPLRYRSRAVAVP